MSFGAGEAVAVPEDERALLPSFHRTLVVTGKWWFVDFFLFLFF